MRRGVARYTVRVRSVSKLGKLRRSDAVVPATSRNCTVLTLFVHYLVSRLVLQPPVLRPSRRLSSLFSFQTLDIGRSIRIDGDVKETTRLTESEASL